MTTTLEGYIGLGLMILFIVGLYYLKIPLAWLDRVQAKSIQQNHRVDFDVKISMDNPPKISIPQKMATYYVEGGGVLGGRVLHIGVRLRFVLENGETHDSFHKVMPSFGKPSDGDKTVGLVKDKTRNKLEAEILKRYNELYEKNIKDIVVESYFHVQGVGKVIIQPFSGQ